MNAIAIGPLLFSADRFAAIAGIALFWLTMLLAGRWLRRPLADLGFGMIVAGVAGARLMHVARHFDSFAAEPWRVLAIWQGGFDPWGALLALVLVIAYRVRDRRRLVGIGSACVVGVLGWGGILLATQAGPGPDLPAQQLARLEGGVTSLAQLSGQPMIVNLWAGWCPPCVREMPLLNAAAAANPDVTFVFVNQGDERPVVARFLADQGLSLPNVLLDPNWQTLHHYDGLGLPTTLFLAADGSVLHSFAGEVSPELLAGQLQALRR